ncbi:putative TOS1-like glycosyl hydrolase-domain-containing protein [Dendryphion nanum]|uniref:glucan endo-1,3-beta-D-glucosidase n=1 Tax=Dendryphion nanum TaxID=256645 RepID=A0A9P9DQ01_9PLEO|nr:putative TOS1-like glycosyl hydrolase-domain-containing protein [Dendryphion nanum]
MTMKYLALGITTFLFSAILPYCAEVQAITYHNISQSGVYNRTTGVDPMTGLCAHETVEYSAAGPLSPLFGELSMHLRGPMNVSQIAVYVSTMSIGGDPVFDNVNEGKIAKLHALRSSEKTESPRSHVHSHTTANSTKSRCRDCQKNLSTLVTVTRRVESATATAQAAGWNRIAYYTSSAPAQATGIAFLANLGDERKSGTFDYAFGNSLGYVSTDGLKIANGNTPFQGNLRTFFIEFQMDHYDNLGTDQGLLSDAPALWFLNAAIPRILQYGNDRNSIPCSCWSTGCGEFDAFEILGRGEIRAKSTIHRQGNLEGGDSNWFRRPVRKTMKFAVVFHEYNITAVVLDDGFDFLQTLNEGDIQRIIGYDADSPAHSLFAIGD